MAKTLFTHQIINEEIYIGFMNCIEDRNQLSHVYKHEIFDEVHKELEKHFITIDTIYQTLTQLSV